MSEKTISFSFKVEDGENGLKTLTLQASDLQKIMGATVSEAQKLNNTFVNYAAISTGLSNLTSSLQSIQSLFSDLTKTYDAQNTVETKLAVNMRNTMGAREDDIQSIKDLCSAQQELGVIGDEVQLAGAQEMATYLSKKGSLEALIPVMNDMLAQQYGLNATQESAAQIASMLGKVMNGQTEALSRYGYSFTEAQKKVLEFGTEEERAAMLAAIVEESVGGMNKALAETDSGKFQQKINSLGDMKEYVGGILISIQPFLATITQLLTATNTIRELCGGIKVFYVSLYKLVSAIGVTTIAFIKNNAGTLAVAAGQKIAAAATAAWTAAQNILNMVLSANPIGAVILAVTALVGALIYAYNNSEDFREIVDKVWASVKSLGAAIMRILVKSFEWLIEKCKIAWEWLKNIFGLGGKKIEFEVKTTHSSTDIEDLEKKYAAYEEKTKKPTLITKSNDPVWVDDAKTLKELTDNLAVLDKKLQNATVDSAAGINHQRAAIQQQIDAIRNAGVEVEATKHKWTENAETIAEVEENIRKLNDDLDDARAVEARAKINQQLREQNDLLTSMKNDGVAKPEEIVNPNAFKLGDIENNISILNKQLLNASEETAAAINTEIAAWQKKADAIRNAGQEAVDTQRVICDAVGQIGSSLSGLGSALELPELNIVGVMAQAIATMVQGYATASAQAATMGPFAWMAFAATGLAQLTAIVSSVKSLPAFANGGIVSGPTVGLIGEYAGASNNPEVVAPLDKLRSMLNPAGQPVIVGGTLRASGRDLVCVLANETRIASKSGRRTNIKL